MSGRHIDICPSAGGIMRLQVGNEVIAYRREAARGERLIVLAG